MSATAPVRHGSKKKAGWALGLAFFPCCFIVNIVAIVMAVQVIRESEAERVDYGRGLAIGALGVAAAVLGYSILSLTANFMIDEGDIADGKRALAPVVQVTEAVVGLHADDPRETR